MFTFYWINSNGQEYNLANIFTVNEGLPSNLIYDLCLDDIGFLWIATDNGVSRFDGTHFMNYSIKNGLPSNDVLQIVKEKNGTIWANCYKQPPSYFNETTNRFVSYESNKQVLKISSSLLKTLILPYGGILFQSELGAIEFKNNKLATIYVKKDEKDIFIVNNQKILSKRIKNNVDLFLFEGSMLNNKNKLIGSLPIDLSKYDLNSYEPDIVYYFSTNSIKRFKNIVLNPFSYEIDSTQVPESIKWHKFTDHDLIAICHSGSIYIYDKLTLELRTCINNKLKTTIALKDKNNNIWAGTFENGLFYYNTAQIQKIKPDGINNNFLSILKTSTVGLLAGNFQGEIFEMYKEKTTIHLISSENKTMWLRQLFSFGEKIIALSDAGYSSNFTKNKQLLNEKKLPYSLKTGAKFNDSILLIGTNTGILKLNINNYRYCELKSPKERILAIEKNDNGSFYFVANQGIFKYDYQTQTYTKVYLNQSLNNDRINLITLDANKSLWISTIKGNLLLIRNDKVVLTLSNSIGLPDNMTNLLSVNNKLWIASKTGIYVIEYSNLINCSLHKLSKSEGLTSNTINAICFYNDTIYAATNEGISKIPAKIQFSKFDVIPSVVSITIHNKKVPYSTKYFLAKDEKNIIIQLAGIELSGHLKKFQYSFNNENNWIDIEGTTLNLSLNGGENNLAIRAIDVNNNISSKKVILSFKVAIPYYQTPGFWILITLIIVSALFWLIRSRELANHKRNFQQKLALEQQRNAITADLHDEIGSSLSSLQINSSVANQLINKNSAEAQKVLDKIEYQSQHLADKIGDIIWSMKPGKDEFMTMSSRIRNFANDILGSTNIIYNIRIDKNIDVVITDITARKNIVLVIKEAINNTAKYSQATNLDVRLEMMNKTISIEISDNGIGFNILETKGNGIGNMRKRVEELNGSFIINSSKNIGTSIGVTIPYPYI